MNLIHGPLLVNSTNINIIILDTPRENIIKRFRYIYFFYLSFRASINALRLFLNEFIITSNRDYKLI